MPKLSELTSINAMTRDDEFVVTNDPSGTPGTRRITRQDFNKSDERVVNVLDYGAVADNSTDCSAAFQAAIDALDTSEGGIVIIPPGLYYLSSGIDLNDFSGGNCQLQVIAWGAQMRTDQAIAMWYAYVADNTEANIKIDRRFIFHGGIYRGTQTAGQKAFDINATYASDFYHCQIYRMDIGMELRFCLQASIRHVFTYVCLDRGITVRHGNWTGATTANSQSNHTVFLRCHDSCSSGQFCSFEVQASSGCRIVDCISEGLNPSYAVVFNSLASTVVRDFHLVNLHNENFPSIASILCRPYGGVATIDGVNTASADALVDIGGRVASCIFDIRNIGEVSSFSNIIIGDTRPGDEFIFTNIGWDTTIDMTDDAATYWGTAPVVGVKMVQYAGNEIRSPSLYLGSEDGVNVDGEVRFRANQWFETDDNYDFGGIPNSVNRRPHRINVGTGASQIEGPLTMRFSTTGSGQIADATNSINTTNKYMGRAVWDFNNNRLMVASGSNATDPWYVADGSTSVTPS